MFDTSTIFLFMVAMWIGSVGGQYIVDSSESGKHRFWRLISLDSAFTDSRWGINSIAFYNENGIEFSGSLMASSACSSGGCHTNEVSNNYVNTAAYSGGKWGATWSSYYYSRLGKTGIDEWIGLDCGSGSQHLLARINIDQGSIESPQHGCEHVRVQFSDNGHTWNTAVDSIQPKLDDMGTRVNYTFRFPATTTSVPQNSFSNISEVLKLVVNPTQWTTVKNALQTAVGQQKIRLSVFINVTEQASPAELLVDETIRMGTGDFGGSYSTPGTHVHSNTLITGSLARNGKQAIISGGGTKRIFEIKAGAILTVRNIHFKSGYHNFIHNGVGPIAWIINAKYIFFDSCIFADSQSQGYNTNGGALTISNSSVLIMSSLFKHNQAKGNSGSFSGGGAIEIDSKSFLSLVSVRFVDNIATTGNGNDIYVRTNDVTIDLVNSPSQVHLTECDPQLCSSTGQSISTCLSKPNICQSVGFQNYECTDATAGQKGVVCNSSSSPNPTAWPTTAAPSEQQTTVVPQNNFSNSSEVLKLVVKPNRTSCVPGQYIANNSSNNTNQCSSCPANTYSGKNAQTCTNWTDCSPGKFMAAAGSASNDRSCAPCPNGTFTATANEHSCTEWAECSRGKFVAAIGNASKDRRCAPCANGTFTATANEHSCTEWAECSRGKFVAAIGNASKDRRCAPCTNGTFTATANEHLCSKWADCSPGKFVAVGGSARSNRSCAPCANGTFTATVNENTCAGWTVCRNGTAESTAGSASADRVCQAKAATTTHLGTAVSPQTTTGVPQRRSARFPGGDPLEDDEDELSWAPSSYGTRQSWILLFFIVQAFLFAYLG